MDKDSTKQRRIPTYTLSAMGKKGVKIKGIKSADSLFISSMKLADKLHNIANKARKNLAKDIYNRMTVKYFNGDIDHTFDFVVTTLNAIITDKGLNDDLEFDKEFGEILLTSYSKLSSAKIKMAIYFYENKKQTVMEFTKLEGSQIDFLKRVKYYKKKIQKTIRGLIGEKLRKE